jgi:hypothetical protein
LVVVVVLVVVLVFVLLPVGLVSVPEASPRLSLLLLCWLPLCSVPLLSWLLPEAPDEEELPEVEVPEPLVVPPCVPDCVPEVVRLPEVPDCAGAPCTPLPYFWFWLRVVSCSPACWPVVAGSFGVAGVAISVVLFEPPVVSEVLPEPLIEPDELPEPLVEPEPLEAPDEEPDELFVSLSEPASLVLPLPTPLVLPVPYVDELPPAPAWEEVPGLQEYKKVIPTVATAKVPFAATAASCLLIRCISV